MPRLTRGLLSAAFLATHTVLTTVQKCMSRAAAPVASRRWSKPQDDTSPCVRATPYGALPTRRSTTEGGVPRSAHTVIRTRAITPAHTHARTHAHTRPHAHARRHTHTQTCTAYVHETTDGSPDKIALLPCDTMIRRCLVASVCMHSRRRHSSRFVLIFALPLSDCPRIGPLSWAPFACKTHEMCHIVTCHT